MFHVGKNIGSLDRVGRFLLGAAIIVLAFFIDTALIEYVVIAVGILVLLQGVVGWCAFYALIGRTTCPVSVQKK